MMKVAADKYCWINLGRIDPVQVTVRAEEARTHIRIHGPSTYFGAQTVIEVIIGCQWQGLNTGVLLGRIRISIEWLIESTPVEIGLDRSSAKWCFGTAPLWIGSVGGEICLQF